MKTTSISFAALALLTGVSALPSHQPQSSAQTTFQAPSYDTCCKYAPGYNERVPKPSVYGGHDFGPNSEEDADDCRRRMASYSAAADSLQCKGRGRVSGGRDMANAIEDACNKIINTDTGNMWLEKGLPYTANITVSNGGRQTQFALQILIGGFTVSHDFCAGQLSKAALCTDESGNVMGGCAFTTDKNLQSCIFA